LRRNYGDDARSEVILDKDNNIILTSCTQSNNFPVVGTSLNSSGTFGGGFQDGLVLKFNSTISSYLFGSFFGGSGDDACFVASINPLNNVLYIAGGTTSVDLPGNKVGVISNAYNGGVTDGYISSLKLDGSGIVKSTYLGTSGVDIVYGLKFDRLGFPYVMGTTTGNWPVINASYSNPNSSQFISKLKPDFSGMVYSTVFGNGSLAPNLSPIGFMVDRCENVYVSGWGGGINVYKNYSTGTTNGLPLLNPLSGVGTPDGEDFYFFVLKRNAAGLLFASNFGQYKGNTGDHVDGGTSRFDENGTIYQAICANCNGGAAFPTTIGTWSRINGSINCNEAAVKIEMNFTGVTANAQASINGVKYDTAGCIPFRVDFTDTLQKAKKIYWNFGNGVKDTTIAPNFTTYAIYNTVGTYTVTIIAEDSTTCNVRDTFYLKIKAGDNLARLAFNAIKDLPCTGLAYSFNNLSIATRGSFNAQSFTWDFGDGSPKQTSFNGYHVFPLIGTYTVTLELIDNNFCNAPEKITKRINVNPLVEAKFTTAAVGCAPYTAIFTNLSGTSDVTWQFSDGTNTNTENPIKVFNIPGTYQVRLIARDTNTCNKIDTSGYFTILVSDKPNASFGWQPNPPLSNTPLQFTNTSIDATHYLWQFGDGASSTLTNPAHLYNESGDFTVVLIAYNQYECADTFSLRVKAIIDPLLDVPNAFTPGKFGENSVIKVKGFGIGKLDWKIYNRWGQMIFQTNDLKVGWDGTFKGKLQPMDVYAYTLEATLTNGQKIKKSGDITLLK
jgi:gliding motility-associated-like protein